MSPEETIIEGNKVWYIKLVPDSSDVTRGTTDILHIHLYRKNRDGSEGFETRITPEEIEELKENLKHLGKWEHLKKLRKELNQEEE